MCDAFRYRGGGGHLKGVLMVKIAILGYGTVGGGITGVLDRNRDDILSRFPEGIEVKYILDIRDFPDDPYGGIVVHDFNTILDDPEVSIVCETIGGMEPAFSYSKAALERGKSVCTSNKELVAAHGPELLAAAEANGCNYLFEASVGGGIPIIRPMNTSLAPETIRSIVGILNGTTNYILTRMEHEGTSFEDALAEAQAKGYAELHPEADVDGYDPCRKIAILSSLACGHTVNWEDVPCEGIRGIAAEDFTFARAMGMAIKLLGVSRRLPDGSLYVRTAPHLVPAGHPLHGVEDVFNGIFVHGETVDNLMFYGRGAGRYPTASAVVSDVVECARRLGGDRAPCAWKGGSARLADMSAQEERFYVRAGSADIAAAEAAVGADSVLRNGGSIAFVTPPVTESGLDELLSGLTDVRSKIRILAED